MSVLAKGMEMPSSCSECGFGYDYRCGVTWKEFDDREDDDCIMAYNRERMECCPLVEIPKNHGRIIDERELFKQAPG